MPALTDETQTARIIKGANNEGAKITSTSLAAGKLETAYTASLTTTGTGTVKCAIERGELPDGISMSDAGAFSGTPTKMGKWTFTVIADNGYGVASKEFTLEIGAKS